MTDPLAMNVRFLNRLTATPAAPVTYPPEQAKRTKAAGNGQKSPEIPERSPISCCPVLSHRGNSVPNPLRCNGIGDESAYKPETALGPRWYPHTLVLLTNRP